MNYKFIAIILIPTVFVSFSFFNITNHTPHPPGTVKIVDNFFFDEAEISNIDWKEYVFWLKKEFGETSDTYLSAIPDTTVWLDLAYGQVLVENYYDHPSYESYPVVGISHRQAVEYCKWRTERVKEMWEKNFGAANVPNLRYRLPTKTEWELVANTGYQKPSKKVKRRMKGTKGITMNVKIDDEHFKLTAPSRSYLPNKHGIYNLFGNVAEMVAEEGIAKGGSWNHDLDESVFESEISYEKPTSWLGFRCVAEIMD
jgi:formylglycine-generating enzyme required for sulfatase activity